MLFLCFYGSAIDYHIILVSSVHHMIWHLYILEKITTVSLLVVTNLPPHKITHDFICENFWGLLSWWLSNLQYGIICYSHHAIHYLPMTLYNWMFVPLEPFHSFCPPWIDAPFGSHQSIIYEFCLFFHFRPTCKSDIWYLSSSVWLTSLSMTPESPSVLLQVARFHFFIIGWAVFQCIHIHTTSLSNHPLTGS